MLRLPRALAHETLVIRAVIAWRDLAIALTLGNHA
jgi:hypothetical protein